MPRSQIDAQLSYEFDSGALSGLTLLLQGNNLTNEHAVTRQSPETVGAAGSSTGLLPWLDDNYGRVLHDRRVVQALRSRQAGGALRCKPRGVARPAIQDLRGVEACRGR